MHRARKPVTIAHGDRVRRGSAADVHDCRVHDVCASLLCLLMMVILAALVGGAGWWMFTPPTEVEQHR